MQYVLRIFRYCGVLMVMLVILMVVSDKFELLNISVQKPKLEKILNNLYDAEFELDEKVLLRFFPFPHLNILSISATKDNIQLFKGSSIEIFPILSSLFSGIDSIKFKKISFDDCYVNGPYFIDYIKEIKTKNANLWKIIPNIIILKNTRLSDANFTIKYGVEFFLLQDLIYKKGNSLNDFSISNNVIFNDRQISTKINFTQLNNSNNKNIDVIINGEGVALEVILKNFDEKTFSLDKGKVILKISDLTNTFKYFKIKKGAFYNDETQRDLFSNFIKYLESLRKKTTNTIQLTADIVNNTEGQIKVNNFHLLDIVNKKDDIIDIDCNINKISNKIIEVQSNILIDEIDIKKLNINVDELDIEFIIFDSQEILHRIILPDGFSGSLNVNVKDILINDKNKVSNLAIKVYAIPNCTIVKNISVTLPNDINVVLNGTVADNNIRSKFDGYIKLNKTNVSGLAKLNSIPNLVKLSDLYVKFDINSLVHGNLTSYNHSNHMPFLYGIVKTSNLDFDTLGVSENFLEYVKKLYVADYDISGNTYFKATNNDNWLRSISRNIQLDVMMSSTKIFGETFRNINAHVNLAPSNVRLDEIFIDGNDKFEGNMSFSIHLPVFRPQFKLKADLDILDLNIFDKICPSWESLENNSTLKRQNDTVNNLNFFSASNYDGQILFNIKSLSKDKSNLAYNSEGEINLRLGTLFLKTIKSDVWEGTINANGNILTSLPTTIAFNTSIYNINPQQLFIQLTDLDKMSGYLSLAGSVVSSGNTSQELLQNSNGEIKFAGAEIGWNGFNINEIVDIVNGNYVKSSKLDGIKYYSQYGSSIFDSISGNIDLTYGLATINNMSLKGKTFAGASNINYNIITKDVNSASVFSFIPLNDDQKPSLTVNTNGKGILPNLANIDVNIDTVLKYVNSK